VSKVTGEIPNLINGVSQQASALRLPTQAEEQLNYYSTIVEGLRKRPPTQHVAKILDTLPDGAFFHIINRDEAERYVVVITDQKLQVFDFEGTEKTVNLETVTYTALDAVAAVVNGDAFRPLLAPGDTAMSLVVSGITTATVLLEESTTGAWAGEETTKATVTADGTTAVTVTSGRYYRCRVSSYTSGTITATLSWKSAAYLDAASPVDAFRALTVADYTFITNRNIVCAMDDTDTSATRPYEALVNIIAGNYGKTYEIKVNGSSVASYTTPDGSSTSHTANIATTAIATELYNDLVSNLGNTGNPWAIGIHGNALHIVNYDDDFTVSVTDGVNGNAHRLAKGSIQKFSDLPNYGPQDFVIEVGNSEGTTLDNYWVRADKGGSDQNSKVVWKETVAPGTVLSIDASTMPHILVREADGTFTFKRAVWDERKCGDGETISPDPSFIGNAVEDIVFHRNRLGFLADESVVLSRSGSFFDFFRTTATALLDDDPIDVASTHVKVSFLKHALPHQDYLLLFSQQTQFRLAGNDLLTAKTVSIRPLTEFNTSKDAPPIANGGGVFFTSDDQSSNEYATVFEYTLDKSLETANADDITAHIPSYIPSGVFRLAGSPDENVIVLLTRGAADSVFIYRYYWVNDEKVQSSWSKWTLAGGTLLDAAFIGSDLYVLVGRDSKVFLEKFRMEPAAKDDGLDFLVYLDRRVLDTGLAAPSYDAGTGLTTYTLPYAPTSSIRAVVVPGGTGVVGSEATVDSVTGSTVKLVGDTTGRRIMFGYPFTSQYRFSTFYARTPSSRGGTTTKTDGRLQVISLSIAFNASAYFRVVVSTENRDPVSYPFNGIMIGSPQALIGEVVLEGGRFNVPVLSRNDRVTIDIINDTWLPSNFLSATWHGIYNPKARQV